MYENTAEPALMASYQNLAARNVTPKTLEKKQDISGLCQFALH
jgi:hypothetical protein